MSDSHGQDRVVPDEERARALLEQLRSVHAVDIARDMAIAAVNFSYPKLGLSDETRAVRDLDDVRVSIELIRAILEVLDREHGGGEKTSDLHDTLAQMQLAYAHAVQLANAERAATREQAAGEPASPAPDDGPVAADAEAAVPEAEPEVTAEPKPKKKPAAKKPAAKKPAARKKPAAKKKPAGDS
jgi:hypothetical protein